MSYRPGTEVFLIGTTILTFPSLLSTYHRNWGFDRPFWNSGQQSLILKISDVLQIYSSRYTIITHLFHHDDFQHWLGNTLSIWSSALSLDLGFMKTALIYLGGGLFGVIATILEQRMSLSFTTTIPISLTDAISSISTIIKDNLIHAFNNPMENTSDAISDIRVKVIDTIKNMQTKSKPEKIISLYGSSACAFSLIGAQVVDLIFKFISLRPTGHGPKERLEYHQKAGNYIVNFFFSIFRIGIEIYMMQQPNSSLLKIGHAAHVGGFLFGVITMSIFKILT